MTDGCDSSPGMGVGQHVIGIKAITFECNKQVARNQRAGVGHHPIEKGATLPEQLRAGDPVH